MAQKTYTRIEHALYGTLSVTFVVGALALAFTAGFNWWGPHWAMNACAGIAAFSGVLFCFAFVVALAMPA